MKTKKMRVCPKGKKKGLHCHSEAPVTESEGFEPSRRLRDLPHFECGPFGQLGYDSPL